MHRSSSARAKGGASCPYHGTPQKEQEQHLHLSPHSFLNEHLPCPVRRLQPHSFCGPTLPPAEQNALRTALGCSALLHIYEHPSRGQALEQKPKKGGRADCVPVPRTVTCTSTMSSDGDEEVLYSRCQLPTQSHLMPPGSTVGRGVCKNYLPACHSQRAGMTNTRSTTTLGRN